MHRKIGNLPYPNGYTRRLKPARLINSVTQVFDSVEFNNQIIPTRYFVVLIQRYSIIIIIAMFWFLYADIVPL